MIDIGIIGGGVAGAFASLRISQKYPGIKAVLFEFGAKPAKRRRQIEGWLGCLPAGDGKIYPADLNPILDLVDGRRAKPAYNWVMETFGMVNHMKLIKDTSPNASMQKRLEKAEFQIKLNDHIQWKPESIHQLSRVMSEEIENAGNVQFSFDNEVHNIMKKKGVFHVSTSNGEFVCKRLILCVGRSGWRWVNKLYRDLGLIVNDDYASIGIRVEISSQHLKDFNKSHCTLTKDSLEIGPLSWSGTVIPEDHADLVLSNFRSNEDRWKTDKVSFSLLSSRYFKEKGCYEADRLGKLAFILFNDRVSRERLRLLVRNNSQLSHLQEYSWLKEALEQLDSLIPNLIARGYFYVPNIAPMASKIRLGSNLETEIDGLFVAGESAGIRGIAGAAISGCIAAESASK